MLKRLCMGRTGLVLLFIIFSGSSFAATITVTDSGDSGPNTLRAALAAASSGDTINFTIVNSITAYSYLDVGSGITIDGGGSQVVGLASWASASDEVFYVIGSNITIKDIAIVDGRTNGISIEASNIVSIEGCRIGTDFINSTGRGNNGHGIRVTNSTEIYIGDSANPNVISGNTGHGVYVVTSTQVAIQNNLIGITGDGLIALANGMDGICFGNDVWSCAIGGDRTGSEGNVISGNSGSGIKFESANSGGNTLCGNFIGLSGSGGSTLGNSGRGIDISGSVGNYIGLQLAGYENVIGGNSGHGIYLHTNSKNNIIKNNTIGLDATGAIAGQSSGIQLESSSFNLIGGNRAGALPEKNIISGQTNYDIYIDSASYGNSVCGNYIGTSVDGTAARDNGATGIYLLGMGNLIGGVNSGSSSQYGNVISGHNSSGRYGVVLLGEGNTIVGNTIGLNAAGDTALPNYRGIQIETATSGGNVVGGSLGSLRNVISGNTNEGLRINNSYNHRIMGNFFGLNSTGDNTVENGSSSFSITGSSGNWIGGLNAGEGNHISGSISGLNISTGASNNTVVGNFIGVHLDLSPSNDSPFNGIYGNSNTANFIGIPSTGQGNLISNCTNGIRLSATCTGMFIYGNTISANSATHIQFMTSGTTGNNDKASPIITGAYDAYIEGTAAVGDFIEIFKAENVTGPDGSLSYVGSTIADGSGNWQLITSAMSAGEYVVATATDLTNGTSKLSSNRVVNVAPTATPTSTLTVTLTVTQTPIASSTPTITPTTTITPTSTVTPVNPLTDVDLKGKTVLAYPNPANTEVTFLMHLEQAADVIIHLYNLAGEKVATLDDTFDAGRGQKMLWNSCDVAPGIYIAKVFMAGQEKESLKIVIIK